MAQVSGTTTTYPMIGRREDLTDVIWDISPTDTPFMNSIARVSASQVLHEWQTDALAAATKTNAVLEGDDAAFTTANPTTRLGNYTQISRKTVVVSGTGRAVNTAGRADELAYQVAKLGRELKRDMESSLCQNNAATAGVYASARTLAGLESWLRTNRTSLAGTSGTTFAPSGGTILTAPTDDTSTSALTEAPFKAIIREVWESGGDPQMVLCGPKAKQAISTFSGVSPLRTTAPARGTVTIVAGADLYRSDFGEVRIVPTRFCRARTVSILDTEYWAVAMLRGIEREGLAKTGDADKEMIITEYTLEARNEKASGKITEIA